MAFAEDLSPFFDVAGGFALSATLNGAQVQVIVDVQTIDELGQLVTRQPSVLIATASATSAAPGQPVVCAGVTYQVRAVSLEPPDGALTRIDLVRV